MRTGDGMTDGERWWDDARGDISRALVSHTPPLGCKSTGMRLSLVEITGGVRIDVAITSAGLWICVGPVASGELFSLSWRAEVDGLYAARAIPSVIDGLIAFEGGSRSLPVLADAWRNALQGI